MMNLEGIGLQADAARRVTETAQRYVERGKVAGLVTALAYSEGEPYIEAYGLRDLASREPMRPDTLVRIASLTKPITAAAALKLIEDGRLGLDDAVADYVPALGDLEVLTEDGGEERTVPMARPITIRHLLTHTSGLAYGLFADSPVESLYRRAGVLDADLETLIETLADLPLVSQPGEAWRYSISYDVLGYLIQTIADMPFDAYLRTRLFQPLEMPDTGFIVPEMLSHRLAGYYSAPDDDKLTLLDPPGESEYLDPDRARSGGHGLVSTAPDYLRFLRMLLNDGEVDGTHLLRPSTVRQMTTNQLDEDQLPIRLGPRVLEGMGYGFGFGVKVTEAKSAGQPSKGTYWWAGITGAMAWVDPEFSLIGVVMTQAARYYEPAFAFQNSLYRALRQSES